MSSPLQRGAARGSRAPRAPPCAHLRHPHLQSLLPQLNHVRGFKQRLAELGRVALVGIPLALALVEGLPVGSAEMFLNAICVHGCTALWSHTYRQGLLGPIQTLGAHCGCSPGTLETAQGCPETLGALKASVLSVYLGGCHLLRSGVKVRRDDILARGAVPLNH